MTPDLIIGFGPRSILSLIGIITLIIGVWYVDRTWDEKGSAAYWRAKKTEGNLEKELDAFYLAPSTH